MASPQGPQKRGGDGDQGNAQKRAKDNLPTPTLLDPDVVHTEVNASAFDVKNIIMECSGTEPLYHASKRPFKTVSGNAGVLTNLHRITKLAATVMRPNMTLDQDEERELMGSGL